MDDATPLGERIAHYRRRRGLSQVKLAGLLGRSESWLSQVERGVRSIDRISVLTQVAAALNVAATELSPDPLVQEHGGEHPTVRAVRLALSDQEALSLLFRDPAAGEARDLEELRAEAARAWELTHAGIPAKVVSERLGHATIAITMDTYSHVLPGLDAEAAGTVARLILGDGDQDGASR